MMNSYIVRFCVGMLAFGGFALQTLAAEPLAMLKTKTDTYSNVTVISRTPTHVFIQHSKGVANLKIDGLGIDTLKALGVPVTAEMEAAANPAAAKQSGSLMEKAGASLTKAGASLNLPPEWQAQVSADTQRLEANKPVLFGVLGGFLVLYLFFCYCGMLICQKAGAEPGVLIWLPVFQIFPLVRAAGMSGWWFLAWFVPVLNIVAQILWCVKIAQVRGKGIFTAILLMLPITGVFAFLYLAFSGGRRPDTEASASPIRLEPLPV